MSSNPTDFDADADADPDTPTAASSDVATEIRETFEVCEDCGQIGAPGTGHRCYVDGGITRLDETSLPERDWRREADERPPSTTVYTPTAPAASVAVYHEAGGCHRVDADDVEAATLGEAKRRDRVPCANPECRRARGDRVYGELYEPLDEPLDE